MLVWGLLKIVCLYPSTPAQNSRLVRTRLGQYYLCIPTALEIRGESQAPPEQKHATMALDPAVCTFMTGYDADSAVYEWGEADMGRIYRLCHTLDDLQSRWSGVGGAASPALSHEGGSAPASA